MVFIWSSGWGPRRRRPHRSHGGGYGPGWGRGRGYGGYGRDYGYRRNDSCLRDLLLLNTGCCLANALGCGVDSMLLAPSTLREVRATGTGERGTRLAVHTGEWVRGGAAHRAAGLAVPRLVQSRPWGHAGLAAHR